MAVALLGAACGSDSTTRAAGSASDAQAGEAQSAELAAPTTGAATLRAGLTGLLTEHVYLAALATGAALRGDTKGFEAYAAALNGPTNSNTVGSVDGHHLRLRRRGRARRSTACGAATATSPRSSPTPRPWPPTTRPASDKAVADLLGLRQDVRHDDELGEREPAGRRGRGGRDTMHATTLMTVIDAQKAGDQPKVYSLAARGVRPHGRVRRRPSPARPRKKFPDKFDGDADSPAAGLRAGLTSLLREHVFLAASATGAALGGRMPQFEAAAAALNGPTDSNTADIVDAIGSVYGAEVRQGVRRAVAQQRPHPGLRRLHPGRGRQRQGRQATRRRRPHWPTPRRSARR